MRISLFFLLALWYQIAIPDDSVIRVIYGEARLIYETSVGIKYEFPVALPQVKQKLPFTGTIESAERKPSWAPTELTREAYKKKFGQELPKILSSGDPRNAMGAGKIRIRFDDPRIISTIRIHGTNDEKSIGQRISRGCIRLRNHDILSLINLIGEKKKVTVIFSEN